MIPRLATALLFPALLFPGRGGAADEPSVAAQSLAQLKATNRYSPAELHSEPAASPVLVAGATPGAITVSSLPLVQLPAFTVVESERARDLDNAIQAAQQAVRDRKSVAKAKELVGTDVGPFRASLRFEAVHGHAANVDFNLLNLSW